MLFIITLFLLFGCLLKAKIAFHRLYYIVICVIGLTSPNTWASPFTPACDMVVFATSQSIIIEVRYKAKEVIILDYQKVNVLPNCI